MHFTENNHIHQYVEIITQILLRAFILLLLQYLIRSKFIFSDKTKNQVCTPKQAEQENASFVQIINCF